MLRSNLSSSLVAAKTSTRRQSAPRAPQSPTSPLVQHPQDSNYGSPESFLELARVSRPGNDGPEAAIHGRIVDEGKYSNEGPSASLLATTAIYHPITDRLEPKSTRFIASEQVDAGADSEPSTSVLLATEVSEQAGSQPIPTSLITAVATSAVESGAVEDDDDATASLLADSRDCLVDAIKPTARSRTFPLESTATHPTFLQKLVTLFAGRRRRPHANEGRLRPVDEHEEIQFELPPQLPLGERILPRTLPLSPPVVAVHRPYQPIEENIRAPYIAPAKAHKHTGDYSVAPDTFKPTEMQVGFIAPASSISPTVTVRRQNSDSILLDRDHTAWSKWYSKKPRPKNMPFAKAHRVETRPHELGEEATEQQAWDSHRASLVQAQPRRTKHMSDPDRSRDLESEEQEAAARLRDHSGHCYGAVTGDVYPFQGGLIL